MNNHHGSNENAQNSLTEVADIIKKKAEEQILRAYYTSVFEMSPLVDRFATWLLAGIGATSALTITNIESISNILPFTQIKIGLLILTVSALFGFVEKFLALDIQSTATQEAKLQQILKESSEEFYGRINEVKIVAATKNIDISAEVDTKVALEKFANAHPWYKRIQLRKRQTLEDAQKARLRRYYRQLTYTVLEFCGFLLFIIIVVASI
ncbi:MAG: hypothetical protein KQI81_20710 [Deltaproteobacteria bacterium]|nr:hypothetical protein [Deltaproteobacteria bacterium]